MRTRNLRCHPRPGPGDRAGFPHIPAHLAILGAIILPAVLTLAAPAALEGADDLVTDGDAAQAPATGGDAGGDATRAAAAVEAAADSLLEQVRAVLEPGNGTTVLHFHATERCADCILIETYVRDAIEEEFAAELEDGRLTFRLVNIDEPANEPLRAYYDIDDTMVVLTRWRKGRQLEWMALWEVWDYVEDPLSMGLYVTDEVYSYLEQDERTREEAAGPGTQ